MLAQSSGLRLGARAQASGWPARSALVDHLSNRGQHSRGFLVRPRSKQGASSAKGGNQSPAAVGSSPGESALGVGVVPVTSLPSSTSPQTQGSVIPTAAATTSSLAVTDTGGGQQKRKQQEKDKGKAQELTAAASDITEALRPLLLGTFDGWKLHARELEVLAPLGLEEVVDRARILLKHLPRQRVQRMLLLRAGLLLRHDFKGVLAQLLALQDAVAPAGGLSVEAVLTLIEEAPVLLEADPRVAQEKVEALVEAAATHLQAKEPEKLILAAVRTEPRLLTSRNVKEVAWMMGQLHALAPANAKIQGVAANNYTPGEKAGEKLAAWLMAGQELLDRISFNKHKVEMIHAHHSGYMAVHLSRQLVDPIDTLQSDWRYNSEYKNWKADLQLNRWLREQEQARLESWNWAEL